jgi:hypothetical protein
MSTTINQIPSIDRVALIYCIKRATLLVGAALLQVTQRKAGFRPDQPRVSAGNPAGGQWVDEDGDADLLLFQGDPNEFPEIPEDPPPSTRERNTFAVRIAIFLLATNFSAVQADRVCRWVWEHARDRIVAYLDEPKFVDELRRAAEEPKPGYESIILWNKLLRGRMGSRRNGFRDGGIWSASRPIDIGRSRDGMRSRILGTAGCHHVIIFGANRGRNDI